MPDTDRRPRCGLLGARRVRQGLGPYYATFLEAAGAELRAFATGSAATIAAAAADLRRRTGHEVRGHAGVDALLDAGDLDAVVIASPVATHEPALRAALAAGVHVLCEKPLLAPGPGSAARAAELVAAFRARGLMLRVNVQWPCTLAAYFELWPDLAAAPVETFWMRLSPASTGARAIADALPHPLSLLQVLVPDPSPELAGPRIHILDEGRHDVTFTYRAGGREVPCAVDLRRCPAPPRPAGYGINGRRAMRRIADPGYRMFLDSSTASVRLRDPLSVLVADFVARLRAGAPPEIDVSTAHRARMLETLIAHYPGFEEGGRR